MNKYHSRIKTLTAKSHNYFSYSDICLIRDYLRAKVEEATDKPDDFQEKYEFMHKLLTDKTKRFEEIKEELYRIWGGCHLLYEKYLYDDIADICKNNPNGYFSPKRTCIWSRYIQKARQHFQK